MSQVRFGQACLGAGRQHFKHQGHDRRSGCITVMGWVRWLMLLLVSFLAGCGSCSSEPGSNHPGDGENPPADPAGLLTIVAMGDSLTAGYGVAENEAYPALLQNKLRSAGYTVHVINAGISGETSSGARSRIEWVVSALQPDIVILETGANDALRGIDPKVLAANLDQMLTILNDRHIQVVLAGMRMLPNLGPFYTAQFVKIYPRLADKHDAILMPFFLEGIAADARYNQPDQIHPNAKGYRIIVDHIYPYVVKAIQRRQDRN